MKGGFNMNEETKLKELLTECRDELAALYRYKAFNAYYGGMGYYEVLDCDVIDLNFKDLIEKIDEVLK